MNHVGVLGKSMDKRDEMPLYCKRNVIIVTMFIREYLYMVKSYLLSPTIKAHV